VPPLSLYEGATEDTPIKENVFSIKENVFSIKEYVF
jgi:hypothetical protein